MVPRNFVLLAIYQIVMRLGWIFKTESIVMPAVLDSIGGSATLRGLLPMLSRLAMAIPPLFVSHWLQRAPLKKRTLALCTFLMGVSFMILACLWVLPGRWVQSHLPTLYLIAYSAFFVFSGLNQISFGTLQGKVMPANLRGRLMSVASFLGAAVAITAVLILLPRWLTPAGGNFVMIFGFTSICMLLAATITLFVWELPSTDRSNASMQSGLTDIARALRTDSRLRVATLVSTLGNCSILLFPHYQALGRTRLGLDFTAIISWIVIQNLGTALFSSIAGTIADSRGNRLAMQTIMAIMAIIPMTALWICHDRAAGGYYFAAVFLLIGVMPVFLRIIEHYSLELCDAQDHASYLAATKFCNALPFLFSGLVGYAITRFGFDVVFLGVTALLIAGFILSFWLSEPRHDAAAT